MRLYTPRRAGARWREGAPPYILDIFDAPRTIDRYTVFFVPEGERKTYGETYVDYLGMSGAPSHPQGFSQWGELDAHSVASYRFENGRYRIRWLELPEHVRNHVKARYES